jgi:hypothetical protein
MKAKFNIETLKNMKSINCLQKKRKRGKKKDIICDITFMNGKEKYSNVFNEVGCEYEKNQDFIYANMSDQNDTIIPIINTYDNEGVYCSIMETKSENKKKRILTCFKTKI